MINKDISHIFDRQNVPMLNPEDLAKHVTRMTSNKLVGHMASHAIKVANIRPETIKRELVAEIGDYNNTPKSAVVFDKLIRRGYPEDTPSLDNLLNAGYPRKPIRLTTWQKFQNWTAKHCGWKQPFPINAVALMRTAPCRAIGECEMRIPGFMFPHPKPTMWQRIKAFFTKS